MDCSDIVGESKIVQKKVGLFTDSLPCLKYKALLKHDKNIVGRGNRWTYSWKKRHIRESCRSGGKR